MRTEIRLLQAKILVACLLFWGTISLREMKREYELLVNIEAVAPDTKPVKIVRVSEAK